MEIEKGFPIPVKEPQTATFSKMEVGDSIFIPNENGGGRTVRNARTWGAADGRRIRFSAKSVDGGVRLWRIV